MSDLVERLREGEWESNATLRREAAAEIEQLQELYDVAVADRVRMHEEIERLRTEVDEREKLIVENACQKEEIERLRNEVDTDRVQHLLNIKRKDAEIDRLREESDA